MDNKSLTATFKNASTSHKKMSWVAKMVRGKKVVDAIYFLDHLPKRPAKILLKTIRSATSNATGNAQKKKEELYIKTINVGRAAKLKRMRFVGRARIHRYVKHRTNITVILDTK